jgi:hypothetical protein
MDLYLKLEVHGVDYRRNLEERLSEEVVYEVCPIVAVDLVSQVE